MNNKQLNEHLEAIKYELNYAEKKHPKFCDFFNSGMTIGSKRNCIELEKKLDEFLKRSNDKLCKRNCIGAIDILDEEIQEARLAYAEGDLLHCLQELAQCAAVILRTMEFVKNEKEKNNEV